MRPPPHMATPSGLAPTASSTTLPRAIFAGRSADMMRIGDEGRERVGEKTNRTEPTKGSRFFLISFQKKMHLFLPTKINSSIPSAPLDKNIFTASPPQGKDACQLCYEIVIGQELLSNKHRVTLTKHSEKNYGRISLSPSNQRLFCPFSASGFADPFFFSRPRKKNKLANK